MGQPVKVVNQPTGRQGVWSFELNRSITGMGHRNYFAPDISTSTDATDDLADKVARQIFELFPNQEAQSIIKSVHINSNIITLALESDGDLPEDSFNPTGVVEMLENLFLFYEPGNQPDNAPGNELDNEPDNASQLDSS